MGSSLFDLSNNVAVVTGGSTGLGASMAVGLAEAGADIVLVDHHRRDETADSIKNIGRKVLSLTADLSQMSQLPSILKQTIERFGRADILVNNAGIIRRENAEEFSEKDWDDVMMLNSKTVFFLSQVFAREMMKQKKGKIINIASLLSFQGGIRVPSYAASKGAVGQLTKALANEWAKHGICVNAIAPGYMVSNNTKQLHEDIERNKMITDRIPAGRWGNPDDLKGAIVYLASDASNYVNGHTLVVDGGWLAR